tara:strand:+ start:944 stop:1141 length:198 start_codon:yes stop_codon:yes gene_type:complete
MARLYVVIKQRQSPIARYPEWVHEIYQNKKEACDRANELNRKSRINHYWVESAPLKEAGSSYWQP